MEEAKKRAAEQREIDVRRPKKQPPQKTACCSWDWPLDLLMTMVCT